MLRFLLTSESYNLLMQTNVLEFYSEDSCIQCDFIDRQEQETKKRKLWQLRTHYHTATWLICILRGDQTLSKGGRTQFCIRVAPLLKYPLSHLLLKNPLLSIIFLTKYNLYFPNELFKNLNGEVSNIS